VLARELSLRKYNILLKILHWRWKCLFMGVVCLLFGTMPYEQYYWRKKRKPRKMCQPCRLPYQLLEVGEGSGLPQRKANRGYFMSPKDLCSVDILIKL